MADSPLESLLLEVGKVAIGLLGGFASGWWIGRTGERKTVRDLVRNDEALTIGDTSQYLQSRLNILMEVPGSPAFQAAEAVPYGRSDERLLKPELLEAFYRAVVTLIPRHGRLADVELTMLGTLKTQIDTQLDIQLRSVQSGKHAELFDVDTPAILEYQRQLDRLRADA